MFDATVESGDLAGSVPTVLAHNVRHVDQASATFAAMISGWELQQRSRFLKASTIGARRTWCVGSGSSPTSTRGSGSQPRLRPAWPPRGPGTGRSLRPRQLGHRPAQPRTWHLRAPSPQHCPLRPRAGSPRAGPGRTTRHAHHHSRPLDQLVNATGPTTSGNESTHGLHPHRRARIAHRTNRCPPPGPLKRPAGERGRRRAGDGYRDR